MGLLQDLRLAKALWDFRNDARKVADVSTNPETREGFSERAEVLVGAFQEFAAATPWSFDDQIAELLSRALDDEGAMLVAFGIWAALRVKFAQHLEDGGTVVGFDTGNALRRAVKEFAEGI